MPRKTKKLTPEQNKKDTNTINARLEKGQSEESKLAKMMLSPEIMNTLTTQTFIKPTVGEIDLEESVLIMQEKAKKINDGDLSELEATLSAQVVSLDKIFNTLAGRSASNMGEYLKTMEVYMRLALKAQAQCARTAEVLAAIKNPPVVFAKQANIAQGHQQVNNGINPHAHAGSTNSANELLNEDNHAPLDTRGTIETSRANKDLATVETLDRSKDNRRKS